MSAQVTGAPACFCRDLNEGQMGLCGIPHSFKGSLRFRTLRITLGWGVDAAYLPVVPLRGPPRLGPPAFPSCPCTRSAPSSPALGVPEWLLETQPSILGRPNSPCCCAPSPVGGQCQLPDSRQPGEIWEAQHVRWSP